MRSEQAFLKWAVLLYALGLGLHTADHLRRGLDVLTPEVQWLGNLSTVLGVAAVVLVVTGHRLGPIVAAVAGVPVAVGVAGVHLLPRWSAFSDAFPGTHGTGVTGFSWCVVSVEIVGAFAMGVAAIAVLRDGKRAAQTSARSAYP